MSSTKISSSASPTHDAAVCLADIELPGRDAEWALQQLARALADGTYRYDATFSKSKPATKLRAFVLSGAFAAFSGAAYAQGQALIRVEGMAGSVAYRVGELRARLGGDWGMVSGAESAALWAGVRDVAPLQGRAGSIWRLVVKQTEALGLVQRLGGEAVYDWGGGLVWLALPGGQAEAVRAAVAGFGHATLMRAPDAVRAVTPAFEPQLPAVALLSQRIRAKFDPHGIFNPGLMT